MSLNKEVKNVAEQEYEQENELCNAACNDVVYGFADDSVRE